MLIATIQQIINPIIIITVGELSLIKHFFIGSMVELWAFKCKSRSRVARLAGHCHRVVLVS